MPFISDQFVSNSIFFILCRICSAVLQDYVAKESSLLELKTEKMELAQGAEGGATSSTQNASDIAKRGN